MKSVLKSSFVFFLMTFLALYCFVPGVAAADGDTRGEKITVGWVVTEDENTVNPALKGYAQEYLQALSQYTGWRYENVNGTLEQCLTWLENGTIDILGFIQKNEEREELFGYPDLPMATTGGILVTTADSALLQSNAQMEGITVGLEAYNGANAGFKKYCEENGISVTYKNYDSNAALTNALDKAEVDAIVTVEEGKRDGDLVILKYELNNQYFVTAKDNTAVLTMLNQAMSQLTTFYPYFNNDLYQKYFSVSASGVPLFTGEEQAFIESHPNILVMYDAGWPPIEYLDPKTGAYKGVSPDLFALLSEKCGINFVYEGSTSGQVLNDLQNEDSANILTTISYDYDWAKSHDVYITQPFITSDIVKFGKHIHAADPVVAINENAYFTYALQDELADVETRHYDKQAERLEAVRTGEADYTFVTKDQANYYRSIPKYSSLEMEEVYGYEQAICISVTKDSDPALLSVLSKALAAVTHDEMNEIIQNNTIDSYQLTFADRLYKNRIAIIGIVFVLLALTAVVTYKVRADREKRRAVEATNRAKSEFLAHVSHDIRTPLNAIIGISTIATKEKDAAMIHDYLEKINESSVYLLGLVNDTLDMSKIESGKLQMHQEVVDIREVYRVINAVIEPKAEEKRIDLVMEDRSAAAYYFIADKFRLEQVLLNLLNNAVKFTPQGGQVRCTVAASKEAEGQIRHEITVADNGLGMSEEFMQHLYEPFEQEHNRISIENAGTGLGLSIVKSIVDMMNGTITCTSKRGEGTTFVVAFTSDLADGEAVDQLLVTETAVRNVELAGKHILLAEDNEMNLLVARKILESRKIVITAAKNGQEAVDAFAGSEVGYFDAVLMDIHMPVMNGLTAVKTLRGLDRADATTVPVIALSANTFAEDKMASVEAGMNDHIAKPIDAVVLFETLSHWMAQRRES